MDSDRFDVLTRFLTNTRSRRVALSALLGGPLALSVLRDAETKNKKGKRKRKRKNNKKQKPPTCSDRKKNGDETDVDCGGTCPPCESGLTCAAPTDCQTRYCLDGSCQTCQELVEACGSDSSGACACYPLVGPPPGLEWIGLSCIQANTISSAPTPSCPRDQVFIATGSSSYGCAKPCGAPA